MDTIDFQGISGRRRRRLHSDEFKADAIAAAAQPGVSMASVAMARGINANLLRRWVRDAEVAPTKALPKPAPTPSTFVPVQLPAPAAPVGDIRLELRRGTTTISVTWPMAAAAECAGCETPVGMLKPGNKKTHKAYIWTYCTTTFNPTKAVVFNFAETRSGENVREFLGQNGERPWKGKLVTDGFSGYKATFERGVTSVGCVAHARRKFHELWANHGSKVGEQALRYFQLLFEIEEDVAWRTPDERRRIRQRKSRRVAAALNKWLLRQRLLVPDGSATAKALDYSLKRWVALTRYIGDGDLPISNNWVENQIRPIALGRANWLFAGSLRAGKRAAAVMSLVHSARINGHDPYAYLKDILERLPTHSANRIDDLLPHRWTPTTIDT